LYACINIGPTRDPPFLGQITHWVTRTKPFLMLTTTTRS